MKVNVSCSGGVTFKEKEVSCGCAVVRGEDKEEV